MRRNVANLALSVGFAALMFASGQSALAQSESDAMDSAPTAEEEDGQGTAAASNTIIVTARRREESVQDIPLSITVSSGDELRSRSVTEFSELQQQTPSFIVAPSLFGNTSTILSSRGLSLTDIRLNIDPVVGVYLDDVYLPRAVGLNATELLDLDRVEILAGPQGTLFGKNTSGGAVRIFTKLPEDDLTGFVRGRVGSYGDAAVAGMLNLPVTDELAFRGVASVSGNDGYGTNAFDGSTAGETDTRYFRLTGKWEQDDFTVVLRGDYTKTDTTQAIYKGLQRLDPLTPGVGLGGPLATVEAAMEQNGIVGLANFLALPADVRESYLERADQALRAFSDGDVDDGSIDIPAPEEMVVKGASLEFQIGLTDSIDLKSLSAVRFFRREGMGDLDGTRFAILQYPYLFAEETQYSTELQLSGTFLDGALESMVGAYYAEEDGREISHQLALQNIGEGAATTYQFADIATRSIGIFTQQTLAVTDRLNLTAGVRWSDDSRELVSQNYNSINCLSLGVPLADIGGIDGCLRPMKVSFGPWSYTLSAEYEATPDILLYATTRRGYRAGGLQESAGGTSVAAADVAFEPFGPEIVEDVELGIKSLLFDGRLRANVAVYRSWISSAIRSVPRTVPGSTASTVSTQNAASERVTGIEWDFLLSPLDDINIGFNGAWTDANFEQYITPTGVDYTDLPVLNSPRWRFGLSAAYDKRFSFGTWNTRVDFNYRDRVLAVEQDAYSPSYELVNARTSFYIDSADLELAFFVKNLTDERFEPSPIHVASLGIITRGPYNRPRTVGFEVTKNF